ncbi:MAG: alanine dehydrogenase, partial [Burkholderiales bacterium]|nr:alanine dehydrogenase [Burkholderiales bacterium]
AYALNRATLPCVETLAAKGVVEALRDDPRLRAGLNVYRGRLTRREVAEAQGLSWTSAEEALRAA